MKKIGAKSLRIGVFGASRGGVFAHTAEAAGMTLVAACDMNENALARINQKHAGVATFARFDDFLNHPMDAVILANYFHEHTPYAIKALDAGKHVMTECTASKTLAECVALCEAVERSNKIFMLAENYPYSAACVELKRLYDDGEIGRVRYAEGEYNHAGDIDWWLSMTPSPDHWRCWIPPTYYCTHALAPLIHITGEKPVSVCGQAIVDEAVQSPKTMKVCDSGGIMLVRTANGAVFRIFGLMLNSIHRVRYECHGEEGYMGTCEPDHWKTVNIHHEKFHPRAESSPDRTYAPDWPEHNERAKKGGHGGGDFWTNYLFGEAIRTGIQPFFDVYRSVTMSAVGILGWRSCINNGTPFAIPDFRDKQARAAVAGDHASPFAEDRDKDFIAPSIRGVVQPGKQAIAHANEVWARCGHLPQLRMRLEKIPACDEPAMADGYSWRTGQPGDEEHWCRIVSAAFGQEMTHATFENQMREHEGFSFDRLFFICNGKGQPVATASGLRKGGNSHATLHYVAVEPDYAGRHLGRAASLLALHKCREEGCVDCMLLTDDFRRPAISTYLKLGFKPEITHESHNIRWETIMQKIRGNAR